MPLFQNFVKRLCRHGGLDPPMPAMQDPLHKSLEPVASPAVSIVDAVDKAIKRSHKTLESCAGFRSSKRAATLAGERFHTGR